jgi:hypothetical protein
VFQYLKKKYKALASKVKVEAELKLLLL